MKRIDITDDDLCQGTWFRESWMEHNIELPLSLTSVAFPIISNIRMTTLLHTESSHLVILSSFISLPLLKL